MIKVIFFGTPHFAVPILREIINSDLKVVTVFTQPPKKSNRGQKISKSEIHLLAEKYNLNIKTPDKLIDEENYLKNLSFDLAVVVAYGQLIPSHFLNFCKHGFINIHASILPKYRGAAPIQRSIMNSEVLSGISIMKINDKLDSGPVGNIYELKIKDNENSHSLSLRLSKLASEKIVENLNLIKKNKLSFIDQDNLKATYAPKILKSENKINWKNTSQEVLAQVNALYPKAWFEYKGERFNILKCTLSDLTGDPGVVLDSYLTVACGKKSITINTIQRQGKNPQPKKEFLIGNKIEKGSKFTNV